MTHPLITRLSKLGAPDRVPPVTDVLDCKPATWAIPARRGAFGFVPQGVLSITNHRVSCFDADQNSIALLHAKEASNGQ